MRTLINKLRINSVIEIFSLPLAVLLYSTAGDLSAATRYTLDDPAGRYGWVDIEFGSAGAIPEVVDWLFAGWSVYEKDSPYGGSSGYGSNAYISNGTLRITGYDDHRYQYGTWQSYETDFSLTATLPADYFGAPAVLKNVSYQENFRVCYRSGLWSTWCSRDTRESGAGSLLKKPDPVLFLDFGTDLNVSFYDIKIKVPGKTLIDTKAKEGFTKAEIFSLDQQRQVAEGVQKVFKDAGVNISVVTQKPTFPSLTVKFAAGASDNILKNLDGLAYDIQPPPISTVPAHNVSRVDQFDVRKDGNVVIALDPNKDSITKIIETVVHEAGHGYGLVHIYDPGHPNESMDYMDSPDPELSNVPLRLADFHRGESNWEPDYALGTHNPAYHLRRYVVGESNDEIGLTPGSWDEYVDVDRTSMYTITVLAEPILGALRNISIGSFGANYKKGEEDFYTTKIADSLSEGALHVNVFGDGLYLLLASSDDETLLDVIFVPDGATEEDFSFNISAGVTLAGGRIFKFNAETTSFDDVGRFSYSIAQVPEPATGALAMAGFVLILWRGWRCRLSGKAGPSS